jgi:cell division protein FtsI/penicillin-binding protein 2
MKRRNIIASVVTVVVAITVAVGGFTFLKQREQVRLDAGARTAADRFAEGWSRRDVMNITYGGLSDEQVAASFKETTGGLGSAPVKVSVASLTRNGDKATGNLSVGWTVAEGATWAYTMPISLQRAPGETWDVVAKEGASMWAPGLDPKAKLAASRTHGKRGDVLDRKGAPLLVEGKVYDVTIDPSIATAATVAELETLTTVGSLVDKLNAAKASGSKAGIPVITYREADFRALSTRLDALPGVIYPPRQAPLPPTPEFARPLLGSYGAVTAEVVADSKGRYAAGDFAGLTGLQRQYDSVLAGGTGVKVTASDKPDAPLFEKPATPGAPMTLTLDTKTQKAAEAALLATRPIPSALVAVDVGTGELLAVANSPDDGSNRALTGRYPPGSTLKVATTYSLLSKGLVVPTKPVPCPPTINVNGQVVRNYEGGALGTVPFSVDFANSCNTAFVGLAAGMGQSDVHDAALALGIGSGWDQHLGITGAFDGSVPVSTSSQERAMTALGQAKTEVSPAALAVMAASVARGTYIEPALIRSPAVPGADRGPKPLDATAVALPPLMSLVVTSGSARTLLGLAGGPVFAKTGTAEYGTAKPLKTRAWVIGWQGDVAFAVLVEDGRSGGTVAAPIAKAFLQNLRR